MAPLKILCLQPFFHKLKWCVCFQHQKLPQEHFAFLNKEGVLFKTETLNS